MAERSLPRESPSANRKRPRASMYQRKRAIAACLPCRARKTKCDNIRPVCGFCASHEAQCNYADTNNDHSSFDPASLAILERINHAVTLLETQCATAKAPEHFVFDQQSQRSHQQAVITPLLSSTHEDTTSLDTSDDLLVETPGFPATKHSCEAILKWPVFLDWAPRVWSLVLGPRDHESAAPTVTQERSIALGRGIQEEQIVPLCENFLSNVHIKNPILEISEFTQYVRDVAENGLRWDGPSCLVLIACALGCIATPFQPYDAGRSPSSSAPDPAPKEASIPYYLAAKKRLSLIEPSLLSVQCHFLCGVLEMYCLKAMPAWHFFNQASVQLQNLLWITGHTQSSYDQHILRENRRLEQRLYWSCMKSECEMRCEIPLPTSGIGRFGFPDMLPSPPTELLSPFSYSNGGQEIRPPSQAEQEEERSWFYYLAEISFRRLMNQAFVAIGGNGEASWVDNIQQILVDHQVFENQIDAWCAHIPPQISLDQAQGLDNELAHHVRQRALSYQEWIHRPFLYYIVHQPLNDPYANEVLPLAKKCLELCVETQFRSHTFHRHHGTWNMARNSMNRALLLLAAARSERIEMPDNWKEALDHCLQTIHYWAGEAEDLAWAETILTDMVATV